MHRKSGQTIFAVLVSLVLLIFIMFLSVSKTPLQILPLVLLLAPIVFIITFINTDAALIMLIFSMLLSPELKIAEVPSRAVVVRIDDILIFVVFFSWLAKTAINKELGLLKRTPLNPLIIGFIFVCIFSTGIGVLSGHVRPLKSFFYIIKYIEYFMLFFLVTNSIRDKKQIKTFAAVFLITCAIICAYTIPQIGVLGRTTAPFEGDVGGPNALGGYLVLLFAVCMGFFLYSPLPVWQFCSGALACFIIPAFLFTLSRGSYLAFIFMYLTLIILTKKKRLLLIGALILAIFILPVILPGRVTNRITMTFIPGRVYTPLGARITLDDSAASRVESWRTVFKKWKKQPILGYGVTGVGLVDTQYHRVLGETGIIGFSIFILLIITIFRHSLHIFNNIEDEWAQGLALGFLAGFVGLLFHCFSANTFIIVRIMEPFWFLAAMVIMLPDLEGEKKFNKGVLKA